MRKLLVLDIDYIVENNRPLIRLFCTDGKECVLILDSRFEPYFYLKPKEEELENFIKKIRNYDFGDIKIKKIKIVEKEFFDERVKLIKIFTENPRNIPNIRNIVKEWEEVEDEYEYTIPFPYRYILDKKIEPMNWIEVKGKEEKSAVYRVDSIILAERVKPTTHDKDVNLKIMAFDLELTEEENEEKIIMISIVDSMGLERVLTTYKWEGIPDYVEVLENEKKMIERFIEIVKERNPNFIVGYNSDSFDFPKLRARAEKLRITLRLGSDNTSVKFVRRGRISSAKIVGRVHVDLYDFVNHILSPSMKTEVLTLDAVAQELIGIGKKKVKWKDIKDSWKKKKDLERIVEYALRDAELTLKLSYHLLPQIFSISRLTGLLPFDSARYTYSQLVENYLVKKAVETNVLVPNRPKYDEIQRRKTRSAYKGAIVIEPKKGIHSNILVFDFASLYPTIIVTHNISPETLNCEHEECKKNRVPELNYHFCTKKKGFIPTHLEELIKKRKEIKKLMKEVKKDSNEYKKLSSMSFSVKTVSNAMYGYGGYFGARWYSTEYASATASWGRFYIRKIIEMAKNNEFEILYGDTDSVFLTFNGEKKILIKKAEEFVKNVNKKLPGIIELEFRGLYEGGIFVARKGKERAAKKRYALIDYDGKLEIRGFEVRRADWCPLAKNIQEQVLRAIMKEKSPEKATKLVREIIKKIKNGKVSIEDLVIYTQLTMSLSQYRQIGPHVKVARKMKERGRPVGEGMIIEYVITKGSGSISDRAEPVEDVKEGEYDPDYYINHQIIPAAMRVLQALDISEDQILSGKIQAKLGKWFEEQKRG